MVETEGSADKERSLMGLKLLEVYRNGNNEVFPTCMPVFFRRIKQILHVKFLQAKKMSDFLKNDSIDKQESLNIIQEGLKVYK